MAMQQAPARKKTFGKGKGKGKFGDRKPREGGFGGNSRYQPKLLGKAYFQRKKGCPFSGPKAPKIDYKDVRTLQRYLSDYGKMLPRHLTGVCAAKQRELATAIKRARMLALLPFAATTDGREERRAERAERGPRREGGFNRERGERAPRAEAPTPAAE